MANESDRSVSYRLSRIEAALVGNERALEEIEEDVERRKEMVKAARTPSQPKLRLVTKER